MPQFRRSVVIDRPRAEVFAFATHPDEVPRWLPGVVRIELLTGGGMQPGARFRETRVMRGREASAVIDVHEHRPPERHVAGARMMGLDCRYAYDFLDEGGGTRIELLATVEGRHVAKLFAGLLMRAMEKQDGEQLVALKTALEARPAGAG